MAKGDEDEKGESENQLQFYGVNYVVKVYRMSWKFVVKFNV